MRIVCSQNNKETNLIQAQGRHMKKWKIRSEKEVFSKPFYAKANKWMLMLIWEIQTSGNHC